ncbi:MAG: DUF4013 domain-containing protein [Chloroflexota bacterium]
MTSNFNLSELFLFPVKDDEARKNFLIATLVYLAAFIIPILPLIVVTGYTARIIRDVVNSESPSMPKWDDWESMLKDGLVLFGVRLVYMLPLFVIFFPLFFAMTALPIWMDASGGSEDQIVPIFIVFGLATLCIFPISLAFGIIVPAAETHTAVHNDFAAGFRFREWWPIFRANVGGFILAYLIAVIAAMILSTLVGIAMMTIILFCIMPIVMPATSAYITFVMYAAYAGAYKQGKDRLASTPIEPPAVNSPTDSTLVQ